jgi:hypothetical protein
LAERLGYPADLLDTLPPVSLEAFAGVSNLAVSAAARAEIFRELARVVRANEHVYVAELVLQEAVSKPDHFTEAEWFA